MDGFSCVRLIVANIVLSVGMVATQTVDSAQQQNDSDQDEQQSWLAQVPDFDQVLDQQSPIPDQKRELFETAACLAVVEAVRVAARRRGSGSGSDSPVSGAEFEFFLEQAAALQARRNSYREQTGPEALATFWDELQDKPAGRAMRQAMLERLGHDDSLARNCIALPALLEQIEFEQWKAAHPQQLETSSTEQQRGTSCSISEPAAILPFRYRPTFAWTGAELIYWGGSAGSFDPPFYNTGFIYDYATDTWSILTGDGDVPSPRRGAYGVASANQFIVYSGSDTFGTLIPDKNSGGVLDLTTREWSATSTSGAPIHSSATVLWTGTEMIIWGGFVSGSRTNTGARYNPSTDQWTAMNTTNAPAPRSDHSAVWTGSEMIVFAGDDNDGPTLTGASYDPSANTWTTIKSADLDIPGATPRNSHTAVWTGSEMLVFGGRNADFDLLSEGLRYNPSTDSWTAMATLNDPTNRYVHGAVWSGSEMIIWAGIAETGFGGTAIIRGGGAYDPSADSWRQMPIDTGLNAGRADFFSTLTGDDEMLVFGSNFHTTLHTGELYDVNSDSWSHMSDEIDQQPAGTLAAWDFDELDVGQSLPDDARILDACGNRDARVIAQPEVGPGIEADTRILEFESGNDDALVFEPGFDFGDGDANAGTEFDFAFDESFTLEALVRIPEGSNQTGSILAKDVGPGQASWWFRVENGVLRALVGDSTNQPSITGNTAINDGHWHHVALVRDAISRSLQLYVDYELDASADDTTRNDIDTAAGTNIVIGAFNAGTRQLQGDMELARISRGRLPISQFALFDKVANLAIGMNSSDFINPGDTYTYQITVNNIGPTSANGVMVEAPLASAFDSASWTCSGSGGAACSASGNDGINDSVDLPAGTSVTYSVEAVTTSGQSGVETVISQIDPPGTVVDLNLDNNSATLLAKPAEVFLDRFESP